MLLLVVLLWIERRMAAQERPEEGSRVLLGCCSSVLCDHQGEPTLLRRLPAVRISPFVLRSRGAIPLRNTESRRVRVPSRYEPTRELLIKRTFLGDYAPNERVEERR